LGGGGRYDRLVEQLGGPPTPAIGWAAGVERILLAAEGGPAERDAAKREAAERGAASVAPEHGLAEPGTEPRVFLAFPARRAPAEALGLALRLRERGTRVEMEQAGRSMKGQLKQADRVGARVTVIFGDEIEVKDMDSGEQAPARSVDEALGQVEELLGAKAGEAPAS
jgi:histidyl-tRNA synthetase